MMTPRLRSLALTALLMWASTSSASASLLVTIGDVQLNSGSSGFVDVTIESDDSAGDLLNAFNFEFRIEAAGWSRIAFVRPQPDLQLVDPDYVFAGDSLDLVLGGPAGVVSTTTVPDDTFIGGDATESGADVLVKSPRLLARLEFTTLTAVPPSAPDQFRIVLVNGPNTIFYDGAFAPISYQSSPGTVTIVTIPEPASLVMLALGSVTALARLRKKARV